MPNWWHAAFAPDRWEIVRIRHLCYNSRDYIHATEFQLRNRYNGRIKVVEKTGEWYSRDFKNNTYLS